MKIVNQIKNAVISEAVKLGDNRDFYEESKMDSEEFKQTGDDNGVAEYAAEKENGNQEFAKEISYKNNAAAMHAANLFCRLASIIENDTDNDTDKKIDGFNKTIVDSKEIKRIMKKKQSLGIKMG